MIVFRQPLPVLPALYTLDPGRVVEIPLNGFSDACIEGRHWLPKELGFQFGTIDGIAKIMPGPIIHEGDQL